MRAVDPKANKYRQIYRQKQAASGQSSIACGVDCNTPPPRQTGFNAEGERRMIQ